MLDNDFSTYLHDLNVFIQKFAILLHDLAYINLCEKTLFGHAKSILSIFVVCVLYWLKISWM